MAVLSFIFTAMVAGFPASGQIAGPPPPAPARALPGFRPVAISRDVAEIRSDIRDGRQDGQLSRKQAKELRREAGEINGLEDRYAQGGVTDSEAAELINRTEVLRAITNAKRSGTIK